MESNNFKEICYLLAKDNREIVLFIGAGINADLVRRWNGLLEALLKSSITRAFKKKAESRNLLLKWISRRNPYEQANLIRRLLGKQYLVYLHKVLYVKVTEKTVKTNKSLNLFAQLCQSQRVHAVVTYNYDDLLEYVINGSNHRKAYPIFGKRQKVIMGQLPIYHVHGYVPWKAKIPSAADAKVILAREEYHEYMLEPFAWQTTVQLDFLRSYVCLYFGASLSDMNMVRIASHATYYNENNSVYSFEITKHLIAGEGINTSNYNEEIESLIKRARASILNDIGVKPVYSDNLEMLYKCVKKLEVILK